MKRFVLLCIAIGFASVALSFSNWNAVAQHTLCDTQVLNESQQKANFIHVGEELTYEVSWWFIKIGTIRTKMLSSESIKNSTRYTAIAYIDSYSGIPFVNLHSIFQTIMDRECFSQSFTAWEKEGEHWRILRYDFDRQKGFLLMEKGIVDSPYKTDAQIEHVGTVQIQSKTQDGLSLLYFARANVKSGKPIAVPTMVDGSRGTTYLNFYNKRTSVSIAAVRYPIDVIEFDGTAEFTGIFGLTGPFKGWFSNDTAQIPIQAEMNVILGTIDIELKQWNRNGWNPPKYVKQ
jgi:hypothetical protein